MTMRAVITGCGAYLPRKIVTNADLALTVETSDEWIIQRTGIKQRHIAADDETTSFMAAAAARQALKAAGVEAKDVDGIIVATTTPDLTFPGTATLVQNEIKSGHGAVFDIQAACSGFIYALGVANGLMQTGQARRMLIVGAERFSNIVDWSDRSTCVLFGDGAGAVLVEAQEGGTGTVADRGVLSTHLHADGSFNEILRTSGGTATTKDSGVVIMDGKEVFRHAVTLMADAVEEVLVHNKITPEQIDWLVPHQANIRIIEAMAKRLTLGMDRVIVTVDHHGNTSAASIPLALAEAVQAGQVKRGDLLLMEALGAGLTWGSALVRF
jgi:3-oxoacyl-[acyl-carrier-protein] synthase-3